MIVTALSRYGRLGASSRLRLLQYWPYVLKTENKVELWPFHGDAYLRRLYSGQSTTWVAVASYLSRFATLASAGSSDLIWIEKEALPWLPYEVERALLPRHVPVVLDYDDAIFHNYDLHQAAPIRWLLGRKIDRVMKAADLVMAGNAYLADRARAAGAARVEIVPTVVDIDAYTARPPSSSELAPRIGWIGSPSTWSAYVAPMLPLLTSVAGAEGARILILGAARDAREHPLIDLVAWSEETEVARIQEMNIGIMPLTDTPWARGKCGYKLIQYMACGLPVVASPVGVNAQIVEHGVNGFLASTEAEWSKALLTLLRDPALRTRMGQAGRRKVEREYSLKVWGPRVAELLRGVAERQPTSSK